MRSRVMPQRANNSYPTCLVYLTLLGQPKFRESMGDLGYVHLLMQKANRHHETW